MGMFFAPLKLNVYFLVLTYDRGVCSMLMIKDGGISCSETNADMFPWKMNFSSAKNWREGTTFPVLPLRLLHVSFSNTPLANLSVNTRSPPYSFKKFGLFALIIPFAIIMSWHLLIILPGWLLLMIPPAILVPNEMCLSFLAYQSLTGWVFQFSWFFSVITLLLPGANCGSDKRIFRIFSSELFNCWSSTKMSCVQANFFLNPCRNFDLIFSRALVWVLHLLFNFSKFSQK